MEIKEIKEKFYRLLNGNITALKIFTTKKFYNISFNDTFEINFEEGSNVSGHFAASNVVLRHGNKHYLISPDEIENIIEVTHGSRA